MEQKIADICAKMCNKELDYDEQLFRAGLLTSYLVMELIVILEEEFQILFEPEEIMCLDNFQCINSIIEIVKKKTCR